jgi:uncharacterized PurR-regulated membrane protein YhhQ (DUF165 family)
MNRIGVVALVGYISTIFAANWALNRYGFVSVGFGLMAPAGVFFAGLAFTFRDLVQRFLGLPWVVVAIVVGAGCSWFVSPRFALASAVAFGTSELLDLAVYTPLERRTWVGAVLASNVAGLIVDSWLFLMLAFGSTAFIAGQIVGKLWMTLAALPVVYGLRRVRPA